MMQVPPSTMSEVRRQGHAGRSSQWSDDCRVRDGAVVLYTLNHIGAENIAEAAA